jgi:hypothetical protein
MLVCVKQKICPSLIPVFTFDPVTRRICLAVFKEEFAHMVPLGMRSNPHKYLVLQEFSGAYWFHLSYYFTEIPHDILKGFIC